MKNRRSLLKIGVISAVSFIVTACTKAVSNSSAPNQDSAPAAAPGGEIVIAQVSALVAGEDLISKPTMAQMQFCLKLVMTKFMH